MLLLGRWGGAMAPAEVSRAVCFKAERPQQLPQIDLDRQARGQIRAVALHSYYTIVAAGIWHGRQAGTEAETHDS
jgi:hypothetical protein